MKYFDDFLIYVTVDMDGNQNIDLYFYDQKYRLISKITELGINTVANIKNIILKIQNREVNEELDITDYKQDYEFYCVIFEQKVTFTNRYTEWSDIEISLNDFLSILNNLLKFLTKYENNEIPNLKYALK